MKCRGPHWSHNEHSQKSEFMKPIENLSAYCTEIGGKDTRHTQRKQILYGSIKRGVVVGFLRSLTLLKLDVFSRALKAELQVDRLSFHLHFDHTPYPVFTAGPCFHLCNPERMGMCGRCDPRSRFHSASHIGVPLDAPCPDYLPIELSRQASEGIPRMGE